MPRMSRRAILRRGVAALVVGAAGVGTWALGRARGARAQRAFPPEGAFVEVDGARLHYVRRGSGPEVVLIHGAGGNLRDFTFDLVDRLAGRYTVTAFDRPGLGHSDRAPGVATGALAREGESPQAQARLLRAAATRLGIARPVVAGHSYGGIVSLAWAVAGLDAASADAAVNAAAHVGIAGVALPWPGGLGAYYTINASRLGGVTTVPLIAAFVPDAVVRDRIARTFAPNPMPEGYAQHIGAGLTLRPASFRANVRQVNTLRPHVVAMEPRFAELRLPIEIVHGDADTTVPAAIHAIPFAQRYAPARLTLLEGVGHMPHHAAPDAVVAAVDRAAARAGL